MKLVKQNTEINLLYFGIFAVEFFGSAEKTRHSETTTNWKTKTQKAVFVSNIIVIILNLKKIVSHRKSNNDHNSKTLFCTGVPLSINR